MKSKGYSQRPGIYAGRAFIVMSAQTADDLKYKR